MIKLRHIVILVHVVFWSYGISYVAFFMGAPIYTVVVKTTAMAILFYVNYFYFVTKLIKKPNAISLIIFSVAYLFVHVLTRLILNYHFGNYYFESSDFDKDIWRHIAYSCHTWVFYGSVCVGTRLLDVWIRNNKTNKHLAIQKAENELRVLKNQIDIPFFTNVLESMRVSSKENPASVQNSVLNLSDVLRYNLYDSAGDTTPLQKEYNIVKSLLEIQKEVSGNEVSIQLNCSNDLEIKSGVLLKSINEVIRTGNSNVMIYSMDKGIYLEVDCVDVAIGELTNRLKAVLPETIEVIVFENRIKIKIN